jgi:hypothetical protein
MTQLYNVHINGTKVYVTRHSYITLMVQTDINTSVTLSLVNFVGEGNQSTM